MSKATGIRATLIEGAFDGDPSQGTYERLKETPGAIRYYSVKDGDGTEIGIIHSCPCGCGQLGNINLAPSQGRPLWTNSGPREAPTLAPSVGIKAFQPEQSVEADGFHWHGFLRGGVWESV